MKKIVKTKEDIYNLLKIEKYGVVGVITGKAIYSGTLDFKDAVRISKQKNANH